MEAGSKKSETSENAASLRTSVSSDGIGIPSCTNGGNGRPRSSTSSKGREQGSDPETKMRVCRRRLRRKGVVAAAPASHPWTRAARRRAEEAQQQVEQGKGATEVAVTNNNEGGEESEPIREMETAGGLEDDEEDLQTVSRATMDGSTSESMAMKIPSDLVEKRVTTSDRLQHQATDIGLMPVLVSLGEEQ